MSVTIDQIRHAMAILANVIETHPDGEKAWPIFERLERELAMRQDREARLKAALAYGATKEIASPRPPRKTNPYYAAIFASWAKDGESD